MNTPVVLITGALTGIGRATAFAFAREGARIVVSGRRDEEGKKLVAEIRSIIWEEWADRYLKGSGLPEHVSNHLAVMALRFGENRYHRLTHDVEIGTGMKRV